MVGTAAHTMTNFQQLGPGQDLEDAMILGALLREAHDRKDLQAALKAYDETRRPRSQDVAGQGKRLGMLWTGMADGIGTDVDKLRQALLEWKETSESFDLVKHKTEVLRIMEEYKQMLSISSSSQRPQLGIHQIGVKDTSFSTMLEWIQKLVGQFGQEL